MGGTGHVYLLVSNGIIPTVKAGKTIFLIGAMSNVVGILYINDTGRPSYPACIIVEHIMI
jgi:hypothetical protein